MPAKNVMLNDQRAPRAMRLLREYAKLVGLPLQYAANHLLCEVLPGKIALLK